MERAPALSKASTWADTERSLAIVTPRIRREPTRSIAKGGGTSVRHLPPRGISISLCAYVCVCLLHICVLCRLCDLAKIFNFIGMRYQELSHPTPRSLKVQVTITLLLLVLLMNVVLDVSTLVELHRFGSTYMPSQRHLQL